jgi:hypothetical protein
MYPSFQGDRRSEYDIIVDHVRQARINSGQSQAEIVAAGYAMTLCLEAEALLAAARYTDP